MHEVDLHSYLSARRLMLEAIIMGDVLFVAPSGDHGFLFKWNEL